MDHSTAIEKGWQVSMFLLEIANTNTGRAVELMTNQIVSIIDSQTFAINLENGDRLSTINNNLNAFVSQPRLLASHILTNTQDIDMVGAVMTLSLDQSLASQGHYIQVGHPPSGVIAECGPLLWG